ncbi:NUDIX domain-containing protein [Halobacterium zhouii]|uniref:NUDIX domain-containing protein n=1 Tax=Halobacterium zhouii TaxID=2902624 RepID=UPI001E552532|nr:NUDIX domain-containing protein [Halobacterium zhouii]
MIPDYCPHCGTELGERDVEGRVRKWCSTCERPVYRNAVPCGDVTVVDGERALLVQRGVPPGEGEWSIPGGHLEVDEEPRVGAARELREETGVVAEPDALTLLETTQLEPYGEKHVVSTAYAVGADAVRGTAIAGSDATAVEWVARGDLDGRETRQHVERRVDAAVAAVCETE